MKVAKTVAQLKDERTRTEVARDIYHVSPTL
jgi:hypothetical protein